MPNHPVFDFISKFKNSKYNFRKKTIAYPNVNTERFKNCFVNRLSFRYHVAV